MRVENLIRIPWACLSDDKMGDLRTVAVVDKDVGGAGTGGGDLAGLGVRDDAGTDLGGGGKTVLGDEVGGETSNMGRGHGGTRERSGGGVRGVVSGEDGGARGEDVEGRTVVGVRGTGISGGGGTDGDGVGGRGGGVVGGVGVGVTGGDNEGDTGGDGGGDGVVQGGGVRTTERHVGNSLLAGGVGGNPVDTLNDTGGGTGTRVVEDLDGDESGLLGDTVGGTTDGTGNVGTVTVTVIGTASNVGTHGGTAAELGVGGADTGVNDVDGNALAGGGVIDVVGGTSSQVRDTAQAPGGTGLGGL